MRPRCPGPAPHRQERRHERLELPAPAPAAAADASTLRVLVSNRIADQDIPRHVRAAVKESLLGLLSEQSSLSHPRVVDLWRDVCEQCDLGVSSLLRLALPGRARALRRMLGERAVRITVKPFMDMSTMLEERLTQCCVHVGTRSASQDQCAPFCAVQAWPSLSAQRLSARSGRARLPMLS